MERAVFNHHQPDVPEGTLGLAEPPALTPAEFEHIRRLAHQNFGLNLKDGKQGLVVARLGKELRRHGFTSYQQYCHHVEADPNGNAMMELANALTTNFTSFLREPAHFEFLKSTFVEGLSDRNSVDIWTAACSTGEEPYSILFTLLEAMGPNANVRILATDLSTRALHAAASAVYDSGRVDSLPPGWSQKYFLRGNGKWQGFCRVKAEYREKVQFERFNLISTGCRRRNFPRSSAATWRFISTSPPRRPWSSGYPRPFNQADISSSATRRAWRASTTTWNMFGPRSIAREGKAWNGTGSNCRGGRLPCQQSAGKLTDHLRTGLVYRGGDSRPDLAGGRDASFHAAGVVTRREQSGKESIYVCRHRNPAVVPPGLRAWRGEEPAGGMHRRWGAGE
ncbi:MAG: CheR family methyltransferase [Ignavibacteriota bacterium]